jgi:23S rRNA (uridine2552-2'-O)-methyltransferase
MEEIPGVHFIRANILRPEVNSEIGAFLTNSGRQFFQAIISDAMSRTTGHHDLDHSASCLIGERVMQLCLVFLSENGNAVLKQFQGDMTQGFKRSWEKYFDSSKIVKPKASRDTSSEIYILFKGFRRLVS